jgi:hypothetical protein
MRLGTSTSLLRKHVILSKCLLQSVSSHVIGGDMNAQSLDSLVAEAEKIKREAYAAGWRDAIAAITKALGELIDPAALDDNENRDSLNVPTASNGQNSKLPKQGSTPWAVIQIVKKHPGMTTAQIVNALHDVGHHAPEGSIRTSIFRVKDRRFIVARHNKWYPA